MGQCAAESSLRVGFPPWVFHSFSTILPPRDCRRLFVQDHTQEGTVDLKSAIVMAIVMNEAQSPELIHKKIDP